MHFPGTRAYTARMTEPLSTHPTDALIRALIASPRPATPDETAQIIARMATAPFNSQVRRIPAQQRGLMYEGQPLGAQTDALTQHLFQRVLIDEQWAPGTTATRYLADIRSAVVMPSARLLVFFRQGVHIAATITATNRIFPPMRAGANALANTIVVYSADRGILLTGYQFTDLSDLNLPEDVQWLK